MAARQQFGATVLGRECIDSDDRRHADRRPWPRNPIELIVIVDWLRRLARTDTDRLARRQQITRLQQAVEQRKHARVLGDALEDRTARDKRADTLRAASSEELRVGKASVHTRTSRLSAAHSQK